MIMKKKYVGLINARISGDRHFTKKEAQKVLEYEDLRCK
jgi:hypothetical protein